MTSSLPKCSFVCVTYNHARYSAAAINSIAQQNYPNIEIIVVDDGSTDGNDKVIEATLKNCGRPYKFLRQENTGRIAMNLNRGLSQANGEYVSMFSLDDILLPDCIAQKMEMLAADPNLAFVVNSCHMVIDDQGHVTQPLSKFNLYGLNITTPEELLEIEYRKIGSFFMQGGVFSSAMIQGIGGYDEDLKGDDVIIRTKMLMYMQKHPSLRFKVIHEPQFQYRIHDSNIHADGWRQISLILEWRDRYFPDRPMPERWYAKVRGFLDKALVEENFVLIRKAKSLSPEILGVLEQSGRLWEYRRGYIKQALGALFSLR
ncbi:glycosyltransferase family A protein [Ruegeria atlantica]|uniref:glycosyltransferase family A protein n=1 Tax=Ruegeria atlantica TaxID=81569 RepID=UPI002493E740|nr:glycosyltransferase family 2 protein [Ruegeria atlantica]